MTRALVVMAFGLTLLACDAEAPRPPAAERDGGTTSSEAGAGRPFVCSREGERRCLAGVHYECVRNFEFTVAEEDDCRSRDLACDESLGCVPCKPGRRSCEDDAVVECGEDGQRTEVVETCDPLAGEVCAQGMCQDACALAAETRSYQGCRFFAADLDNASIAAGFDATAQQYALVVSNPNRHPVEVTVTVNDAAPGQPTQEREVAAATIFPGDLEVFELPRREVDGSSAEGFDDGPGTALTSRAYRVDASLPIIAYQFNPLDNVGVFSNDASLLLPTSSLAGRYSVLGWPQTIADDTDRDKDFDPNSDDEDLRAFLTVIGTEPQTQVRVELGEAAYRVLGTEGVPASGPGDVLQVELGPFDVLNLETDAFNADFTGSLVDADKPVVVFVGSEASDVPFFSSLSTRRCCADHLEEQLVPDASLGQNFVVARMPPRVPALNAALVDSPPVAVDDQGNAAVEPEWVRVLAVREGTTVVETSLPSAPKLELGQREVVTLRADQDFIIQADKPVAVVQAQPSQEVVGIQSPLPGGDPALLVVPPLEQFRSEYVFLTPDKYAFDFVTLVSAKGAQILLDGEPLPEDCTTQPVGELVPPFQQEGSEFIVHRCPLSHPQVRTQPEVDTSGGTQDDGVHRVVSDRPVGLLVYGFDAFVSYAYAGGLNLDFVY